MIRDLRIEYRKDPLGIEGKPRFSWKLESGKQNVMHEAYQIQVASQGKLVWDSGCVKSDQSVLIPYGGETLQPMNSYQVHVCVRDNYGELGQAMGQFETGLMGEENWNARWITHEMAPDETACPVFSKSFAVLKKVQAARLYVTACGVYEARINGAKVGDQFMAPGWTSYKHRIQYQTYDITSLLKEENQIEITVANGWYKGELGFDSRPDIYGDRTALLAMIRVICEDGEILVAGTDTDWDVVLGPIRFSEIYHGETQDYTQEKRNLGKAVLFCRLDKIGSIVARESEPVRVTKRFAMPKKIITPKNETVFDFGQNMAGVVEVKLPALAGEKLVIRHAETLDKDGNFYTENLRTARCTDTYIYRNDQAGAAAWSDAATIIPWTLYQIYGDREMLAEQFPLMKAWVDYIHAHVSENNLWQTGFQYGDWLALDIESGSTDRTGGTDKYLVANAYYAYSTGIVRDAATVLGYTEEEKEYGRLYDEITDAINKEFITTTGRLVGETQTACVLMLYFGLAKPEYRDRIRNTLELNIGAHHNHLTTGFVGTPYLCHCLSENGMHELADEIFMKEDFPGWLYAVKKGATTIWERWNSILEDGSFDESGMNSLNHYAYGSIGSWLYEKVAGIRSAEPGYKKIRIQPTLTKGMTEVTAEYESVYGLIKSAWSCRNGRICVDVRIPVNTTAVLCLPEKDEDILVGSGSYHYEYETDTNLEFDKYTMESTLGELVEEEEGRKMLEELEPGMLDNPLIQFAFGMTISDLILQVPEAGPLYQAVIDALNQKAREAATD